MFPMPPQLLLEQSRHEITHRNVSIGVVLDIDPAVDRPDGVLLNDMWRPVAEVHVCAQTSEIQHEVRFIHARDDRRRADGTDMHAEMEWMVHRKCTLAENGGENRRTHLFR